MPGEFKRLKCRHLTAENWKPVPIVRGIGKGRNNGLYCHGITCMCHIEPRKFKLAM